MGTKSIQIFAYADDVATVSRNKNALKDNLVNIEREARERCLRINENKTKYMEVTRAVSNSDHLRCGKYEFEHVKEFTSGDLNCLFREHWWKRVTACVKSLDDAKSTNFRNIR
jgi:hypothetical protein